MDAVSKPSFELEWPSLAQRLSKFLDAKGIRADNRDDLVQETGLRLFGMWERVDAERPRWPLTVTIALNLLYDKTRRAQREVLCEVPDITAAEDVERTALARIELSSVGQFMHKLRPAYRSALMSELADDGYGRAHKVVRLRARRALKQLVDQASAGAVIVLGRLRGLLEKAERSAVVRTPAVREGFAAASAGAVLIVTSFVAPASSEASRAATEYVPVSATYSTSELYAPRGRPEPAAEWQSGVGAVSGVATLTTPALGLDALLPAPPGDPLAPVATTDPLVPAEGL